MMQVPTFVLRRKRDGRVIVEYTPDAKTYAVLTAWATSMGLTVEDVINRSLSETVQTTEPATVSRKINGSGHP